MDAGSGTLRVGEIDCVGRTETSPQPITVRDIGDRFPRLDRQRCLDPSQRNDTVRHDAAGARKTFELLRREDDHVARLAGKDLFHDGADGAKGRMNRYTRLRGKPRLQRLDQAPACAGAKNVEVHSCRTRAQSNSKLQRRPLADSDQSGLAPEILTMRSHLAMSSVT